MRGRHSRGAFHHMTPKLNPSYPTPSGLPGPDSHTITMNVCNLNNQLQAGLTFSLLRAAVPVLSPSGLPRAAAPCSSPPSPATDICVTAAAAFAFFSSCFTAACKAIRQDSITMIAIFQLMMSKLCACEASPVPSKAMTLQNCRIWRNTASCMHYMIPQSGSLTSLKGQAASIW